MASICKYGGMEMPANSASSSTEPMPFTLSPGKKNVVRKILLSWQHYQLIPSKSLPSFSVQLTICSLLPTAT